MHYPALNEFAFLPGIAAATIVGFSPYLGAAVAAAAMVGGIELIHRQTKLKEDTAIGLLFVGIAIGDSLEHIKQTIRSVKFGQSGYTYVLDGKPEPDHRNGFYLMVSDARQRGETQAENAYLHVKWFKKGSGHVLFKRPDLVEKVNDIIARHYPGALPPVV